jgi:hypothetical protein
MQADTLGYYNATQKQTGSAVKGKQVVQGQQ